MTDRHHMTWHYTWQAWDENGNLVWEQHGTETTVDLADHIKPGYTVRVYTSQDIYEPHPLLKANAPA